jgi:hypothetical protein
MYLIVMLQLSNASIFILSAYQFDFFFREEGRAGRNKPWIPGIHTIRRKVQYMVHRFAENAKMYPSFLDSAYCIAQRCAVQCSTEHSSTIKCSVKN